MSSTAAAISQKAQDTVKIAEWVAKIRQCNEGFTKFEQALNKSGGGECPNFGVPIVIFSSDELKNDSEIQSIELTSVSLNTADRRQPLEFNLQINLKNMYKEVDEVPLFVDFIDTLPLIANVVVPGIRVELSLHRKERLQSFLMHLHKKYNVPIEIIHALLSSPVLYKHYTPAEEVFYEKLRKIVVKSNAASPSLPLPQPSPNASAADAKAGAEARHADEDVKTLMDEARGLDAAYLTGWLEHHTPPLGMESTDPEELAREKADQEKILAEDPDTQFPQRFVSISESLYSLAEVYFQKGAFPQALQILTAIGPKDLFFKYAQLMEVKIKFANCSQVQDKAGRLQRRNLMCELANIDHLGADLLLERLFEIQYGKTKEEAETALMSDKAAVASLQRMGQETGFAAMLDIFDKKFLTGSSKFTKPMIEQMRELFPEPNLIVPAGASYTPSYSASGIAGSAAAAATAAPVVEAAPEKGVAKVKGSI